MNWKVSGVLCDRKTNVKLNGRVYKIVVRPAMMYGDETWAVKKAQEFVYKNTIIMCVPSSFSSDVMPVAQQARFATVGLPHVQY